MRNIDQLSTTTALAVEGGLAPVVGTEAEMPVSVGVENIIVTVVLASKQGD